MARTHPAPRVHQILQRMLVQSQPGACWNGASVFLALPGDITIASALSSTVTIADELQLRLNEGPALQTMLDTTDLLVADTASERRWSDWSAGMVAQGWRSVHTRSIGSETAGAALTLYAHRPEVFSSAAVAAAEQFARRATNAVAAALDLLKPKGSSEGQTAGVLTIAQHILRGRHGLA